MVGTNRMMFFVLGALVVAVGVLGYLYHQERQRAAEFELRIEVPGLPN